MEDRNHFLDALEQLAAEAADSLKYVTREEIEKVLSPVELDDVRMEAVREYLKDRGIGIDEPVAFEDTISEEEKAWFDIYAKELEELTPLSGGERTACILSSMAGEKDAQNRLAEDMLKEVVDIARLYAGQDVYLEDLVGCGNEALITAVSLLAPFDDPADAEGFIVRRVMDAMEDLIAVNLDEKAEENEALALVNLVADKAEELSGMLGRRVNVQELAKETGIPEEDILRAVRLCGGSMDYLDAGQPQNLG